MNSLLFFLPTGNTYHWACVGQAFLFVFGDLSKLALSIGFVLIAYTTFIRPTVIENNKILYLVIIILFCQILPFIYSISCSFIFTSIPLPLFCYYKEHNIIIITSAIRYLLIVIFYIVSIIFIVYFRNTFSKQKNEEFYSTFKRKMKRYIILITLNLFVSIAYSILDEINRDGSLSEYYGIVYLLDGMLIPFYAIIFLIDSKRYSEMKDILCCRKQARESSTMSSEDYQIEIL